MVKSAILMMLSVLVSGATILPYQQQKSLAVVNSKQAVYYETIGKDYDILLMEQKMEEAQELIKLQELELQKQLELEQKQAEIDYVISENHRKENVWFDPYNLLSSSNITADELYRTLSAFNDGALAKFAWVLVDVENIYGINSFFMAGLIAQESGWVTSYRAIYQNNLTGHAVYNSNAEGTYFNSQEESIYNTAKLLYHNYLSQDGCNYYGTSIWNVNTDYCLTEDSSATDYMWAENITSIANSFVNYYHNEIKELLEVPSL